jgi:ketosteroid isomerase-like protein
MTEEDLLRKAYAAFNAGNLEGALQTMAPNVVWPNGMEGGTVQGHAGVREYWTRQWKMIDPHVEPKVFRREPDGRIAISVHQVVKDLAGKTLVDQMIEHVYRIRNGLIENMEIRNPEREA